MGLLVEGVWRDQGYDTAASGGRFVRKDGAFRNWVTPDGAPGPTGRGGFKAEPGRYHLYVSLACPWAHRTLIMRALKGLEGAISVSVVHWLMREQGWTFAEGPGTVPDTVNNAAFLHQVYTAADPRHTGRVTVPVLWDKRSGTIVSNESSEIIRMLDSAFDGVGAKPGDHYPEPLRPEIDAVNARLRHGEQRRVQGRIRHDASRLRGGGRASVRNARAFCGQVGSASAARRSQAHGCGSLSGGRPPALNPPNSKML